MTDISAHEPESQAAQPIIENHIHNDGNSRLFDIVATLLGCACIGMLTWAVAQSSLEIAASGATVFFWWTGVNMVKNGLINMPSPRTSEDKDIEAAKGTIATLVRGGKAVIRRSPRWRLVLIGFGVMCGYLALRQALVISLGFFANPWIAGSATAGFAGVIIGWTKLVELIASAKARRGGAWG